MSNHFYDCELTEGVVDREWRLGILIIPTPFFQNSIQGRSIRPQERSDGCSAEVDKGITFLWVGRKWPPCPSDRLTDEVWEDPQ